MYDKSSGLAEAQYKEVLQSYERTTFYPTDILEECPKFRILVVGQTGAGKTTLCSEVFNVKAENGMVIEPDNRRFNISEHSRGTSIHQVWKEIHFPQENNDIILHDSGGFEAATEKEFDEIRKFIKKRLEEPTLAEQLHCIWYCIPLIGHRHLQRAEEIFFQEVDVGDIPVIAVYTHFDIMEQDHEFALMKRHQREQPRTPLPNDLAERAHAMAVRDYDERERPALERLTGPHSRIAIKRVALPPNTETTAASQGVNELITTTFDMLTKFGSLRRLWTAAQQQSADLKRDESINMAIEYLSTVNITNSIPLLPFLGGSMFVTSFNKILALNINQWGLIDPQGILRQKSTRSRFFEACLKVSAAGRIGTKVGMSLNFFSVLTTSLITAALLKMVAGLALMFEDLFWKQRAEDGLRLTVEEVEKVTLRFSTSKWRHDAAAHIDGTIDLSNCYRRQYCKDVLITAVRIAKETERKQRLFDRL